MRTDIFSEVKKHMNSKIKINFKKTAEAMGCDPRTVKRYTTETAQRKKRMTKSKLSNYEEIIKDKVENYSVTAISLYNFLKTKGYSGSYSLLRKYIRDRKIECQTEAVYRFETEPGRQAQIDWKEQLTLINKNNEAFKINIFLYILGYSRFKYIALCIDRKQDTLFDCIDKAFMYTGGVPEEILFDNMATVIDRASTTLNNVKVNANMLQFSKEYGFNVVACKPYRPQTKGKIEIVAKLMERLRVYNKEFDTIEELDEIVKKFNLDLNNEICRTMQQSPNSKIEYEKKYLQKLPQESIRNEYTNSKLTRKVSLESMINYKIKKYSVPPEYIGKEVEIEAIGNTSLIILYNGIQIAKHPLKEQKINYDEAHMIEIMKSGVFKNRDDDFIEKTAKHQLELLSKI